MATIILNRGNPLNDGTITVLRNQTATVPDKIAKKWEKMGMNIEIIGQKNDEVAIPESNETEDKKSEVKATVAKKATAKK